MVWVGVKKLKVSGGTFRSEARFRASCLGEPVERCVGVMDWIHSPAAVADIKVRCWVGGGGWSWSWVGSQVVMTWHRFIEPGVRMFSVMSGSVFGGMSKKDISGGL